MTTPTPQFHIDEALLLTSFLPAWIFEAEDGLGGNTEGVRIWRGRFLEVARALQDLVNRVPLRETSHASGCGVCGGA